MGSQLPMVAVGQEMARMSTGAMEDRPKEKTLAKLIELSEEAGKREESGAGSQPAVPLAHFARTGEGKATSGVEASSEVLEGQCPTGVR
jgi:hypothetical protein